MQFESLSLKLSSQSKVRVLFNVSREIQDPDLREAIGFLHKMERSHDLDKETFGKMN